MRVRKSRRTLLIPGIRALVYLLRVSFESCHPVLRADVAHVSQDRLVQLVMPRQGSVMPVHDERPVRVRFLDQDAGRGVPFSRLDAPREAIHRAWLMACRPLVLVV